MAISRRKFLRLAPASVGAIALGAAAISAKPRIPALTTASLPGANTLKAMSETMLIAGQRAADPPLMTEFEFSTIQTYYIQPSRMFRRVFGFEFT